MATKTVTIIWEHSSYAPQPNWTVGFESTKACPDDEVSCGALGIGSLSLPWMCTRHPHPADTYHYAHIPNGDTVAIWEGQSY